MTSSLPAPSFTKPSTTTRKPRQPAADKAREQRVERYRKTVTEGLHGIRNALGLAGQLRANEALTKDAMVIDLATPDLATPLAEAIEETPRLAAWMDKASKATPWAAVAASVAMLSLSILVNHRPDLAGFLSPPEPK